MGVNDVDDESYFPCPEDGCACWYTSSSEVNEHIARDHVSPVERWADEQAEARFLEQEMTGWMGGE